MLVWCNWAAACASFLKRCSCLGSRAAAKGNTFSATRRPSDTCSASYTIPMPPRPISWRMRKSPRRPFASVAQTPDSSSAVFGAFSAIAGRTASSAGKVRRRESGELRITAGIFFHRRLLPTGQPLGVFIQHLAHQGLQGIVLDWRWIAHCSDSVSPLSIRRNGAVAGRPDRSVY